MGVTSLQGVLNLFPGAVPSNRQMGITLDLLAIQGELPASKIRPVFRSPDQTLSITSLNKNERFL